MSTDRKKEPGDQTRQNDVYPLQGSPAPEWFARRTAVKEAAFMLPHLRPGMSLLDCGCGPGSITVGLAELMAPGSVVAFDIQPSQVEAARALAASKEVKNVTFDIGNIYEIPYPDATFDAVFANGVLMYLREPIKALGEMRRVLKPGGIVCVRDLLLAASIWEPVTPLLQEWWALALKGVAHNGGNLEYPRQHRRYLMDAGFVRPQAGAETLSFGTDESTRETVRYWIARLKGPGQPMRDNSWVNEEKIEAFQKELHAWGERPDAFLTHLWTHCVAWKPQ